jgi:chromosomal replication initiation ATPase DnaA
MISEKELAEIEKTCQSHLIERLTKEIRRLRSALEFYSNYDNYITIPDGTGTFAMEVLKDKGQRAREALK